PLILLNIKTHDQSGNLIPCWKLIWPIFGITNQLLAALVLVIVYLWSKKENIAKRFIILIPALFMIITTVYALTIKIFEFIKSSNYNFVFFITALLLFLALFIVYETSKSILKKA
ncbi:MAG: carbon starvation CstA family protein, partial [Elusimicrobiales bacterium]